MKSGFHSFACGGVKIIVEVIGDNNKNQFEVVGGDLQWNPAQENHKLGEVPLIGR